MIDVFPFAGFPVAVMGLGKSGGRNNAGRITIWSRGGGHKRRYRIIDFKRRNWDRPVLLRPPELDANFTRAAANIPNVDVLPSQGANVYDILRRDTLMLTRSAVEFLEARLR